MNEKLSNQKSPVIPPVPRHTQWRWLFLCSCLFICGGFIGSILTKSIMIPHRFPPDLERRNRDIVSHMRNDFGLTDEQTKQMYEIVRTRTTLLEDTFRNNFEEMNSEIRAILTAEQIIKFDEWRNRRLKEFPPGPPGRNRRHEGFPGPFLKDDMPVRHPRGE